MTAIWLSFAISFGLNAVFFAFAATLKTDVFTDITYSLTFVALAIALPFTGGRHAVQLGAAALVGIWAIRLGAYLFTRILRIGVDHRFDHVRDTPSEFVRFWIIQATCGGVLMLPVAYLLDKQDAPRFGGWEAAGAAIWLVGLLYESVADAQKSAFRKDDTNRGKFIATGLWRNSRHPNYFGEILVWWGIFVYAVPFLHGAAFATALSPLFITYLLLFGTGIPPLEKASDERYGSDPSYVEYKRRTSILIPLPTRAPR